MGSAAVDTSTGQNGIELTMDAHEVAEVLKCSPDFVQDMAKKRVIPMFKVGKLWRIRPSTLVRWMEEQEKLSVVSAQ